MRKVKNLIHKELRLKTAAKRGRVRGQCPCQGVGDSVPKRPQEKRSNEAVTEITASFCRGEDYFLYSSAYWATVVTSLANQLARMASSVPSS